MPFHPFLLFVLRFCTLFSFIKKLESFVYLVFHSLQKRHEINQKYIAKDAVRALKNGLFFTALCMTLFVSIIYVVYIDTRIMSYYKTMSYNTG